MVPLAQEEGERDEVGLSDALGEDEWDAVLEALDEELLLPVEDREVRGDRDELGERVAERDAFGDLVTLGEGDASDEAEDDIEALADREREGVPVPFPLAVGVLEPVTLSD